MSRSLQIVNGDLVPTGSRLGVVSGFDKLQQDLDIWVRARYGDDSHHPSFGSVLDNYIGGTISESSELAVRSEIMRVLSNYQTLQFQRLQETPEKFSGAELLDEIVSVTTSIRLDAILADVIYRTASGRQGDLQIQVRV
ncbi:hypothetical protein [Streptomyces sp. CoH17]|uniref:hypothetical protein n=1 Tax=Streptomyces sp. CoH17 TaxID=2992806 RepID=UPI00227217F3|nr:hypothetical protein [Streptomyces sp. CoH17]